MRLRRVLAAALFLAAGLLPASAATPSPVVGVGPLPDCQLRDILTVPRGYDDWAITLVDWNLSVGPDYKPPDLVFVSDAGVGGSGLVRKIVIADLRAMAKAAKANGTPLASLSAYRGYKQQGKLFNGYAGWNEKKQTYSNFDDAINFSHRPGHSEHQLGLAIDFLDVGKETLTRTGQWLKKHAWEYGWLMSFPDVAFERTCFSYEPWHYRYVGRDLARKIHESGLTIREYLWANFTQLDASGNPVASATLEPSPTIPAATPAATQSAAPPATTGPTVVPGGPAATSPPSSPAGASLGLDPAVAVALALLVLASVGLVVSLRLARSSRRSGRAGGSARDAPGG
jgi:D-alanyl-D-alanine carboxypeptidase